MHLHAAFPDNLLVQQQLLEINTANEQEVQLTDEKSLLTNRRLNNYYRLIADRKKIPANRQLKQVTTDQFSNETPNTDADSMIGGLGMKIQVAPNEPISGWKAAGLIYQVQTCRI